MEYTERYARQIMLPEIGISGQQALSQASVLLVGLGGLGAPIALYLASAGIGRLGLIDGDVVSESNLQRQILYTEQQIGHSKTECARETLLARNAACHIDAYSCFLTAENAEELIGRYDIVVDGCDNFSTRYLIDDWCAKLKKPYVFGSISAFGGQVSVCNGLYGKRYADLFPDRKVLCAIPPSAAGVIGSVPGVIGSIEATEVIKLITGCGTPLYNRLLTFDLLTSDCFVIDL